MAFWFCMFGCEEEFEGDVAMVQYLEVGPFNTGGRDGSRAGWRTYVCPLCKRIETLIRLCDFPGCGSGQLAVGPPEAPELWNESGIGYRPTCWEHRDTYTPPETSPAA